MGFDPISSVLDIGKTLIDKLIPDPAAKAAATQKLLEMQQAGDLAVIGGQLDVNKIEAANPRLWVSGWRPAVGWVCAAGLAIQYIVRPFFIWGSAIAGHPTDFPSLDSTTLVGLLMGLLGMAGLRSIDKFNGVASK